VLKIGENHKIVSRYHLPLVGRHLVFGLVTAPVRTNFHSQGTRADKRPAGDRGSGRRREVAVMGKLGCNIIPFFRESNIFVFKNCVL